MLENGTRLGHYEIESSLGKGGMGVVYRAVDQNLGRPVALKVIGDEAAGDPDRLARLRTEARAVAALSHPNIVTIFGLEGGEESPFLVLELVEGRPLSELIPAGGMTFKQILEIARPLAEAVAYAHDRGILHRDLKPTNVMVGGSGTVKVLDFGLAKIFRSDLDAEGPTATLTAAGSILGTLPYMSPEQLRGEPAVARSDVFSLGVVLYEAATGQRPFRGRTAPEQLAATLGEEPAPLGRLRPDLPEWLRRLVHRTLEKDVADRPSSAEVVDALGSTEESEEEELAREASLAILPFADLSPAGDQEYFCRGLAEELIHGLSRQRRLKVASRTASFRFGGDETDLVEVGRRLGVEAVLEGSVRKWEERLRIGARLVAVESGETLWDERYDRRLEDVFAVQEEIANRVVTSLLAVMAPGEEVGRGPVDRPHPRAYELYLQGRQDFYLDTRDGFETARKRFRRAIEIDPRFGRAQAGLADCASFLFKHFGHEAEELERALEESRRAVEIAPELAEAHASRGLALHLAGRDEEGEGELDLAVRLDPHLFEAYYFAGQICIGTGRADGAIWNFERAETARPDDYQAPVLLASQLRGVGRYADARAAFERGLEKARAHLDLNPHDVRAWLLGGGALAALGRDEEARKWAKRAEELDEAGTPIVFYNLAVVSSFVGDVDEGLEYVERCLEGGFRHLGALEHDPDLEALRDDPRFAGILERYRSSGD